MKRSVSVREFAAGIEEVLQQFVGRTIEPSTWEKYTKEIQIALAYHLTEARLTLSQRDVIQDQGSDHSRAIDLFIIKETLKKDGRYKERGRAKVLGYEVVPTYPGYASMLLSEYIDVIDQDILMEKIDQQRDYVERCEKELRAAREELKELEDRAMNMLI